MRPLRFIFVVLVSIVARTICCGQTNFYGSIKYKNYATNCSDQYASSVMNDSIVCTYTSNGFYIEKYYQAKGATMICPTVVYIDEKRYSECLCNGITVVESKAEKRMQAVTPTEEFQTIAGYRCQKYVVNHKINDSLTITSLVWVTPDLRLDKSYPSKLEEAPGCPLKIETIRTKRNGSVGYFDVWEAVAVSPSSTPFDLATFLKGKEVTTKDIFSPYR